MEVRFINTTAAKLSSVAVKNGQIIVLQDSSHIYYDLNGTRRRSTVISDNYTSSAGTASAGVAASSKAVADCYADLNARCTAYTTSRVAAANTSVSVTMSQSRKYGKVYALSVEFTCTADIAAFSGVLKVNDDIMGTVSVMPICTLCWDDGSTVWLYQQYNNIMNRTKLLKGKSYCFTYAFITHA